MMVSYQCYYWQSHYKRYWLIKSIIKLQKQRELPKTGPMPLRLKNAAIDQIPISKAPRRQKSSRFYVTEKVAIEATPSFHGKI